MATESNVRSAHGVRTYRGRTLEELLPQIREELGPDAVILREREGLVGGVGGFFAQRFIEVEARRGDGQSIDIYDDAPEDDLNGQPPVDEAVTERQPLLPPPEEPRVDEPTADAAPMDITARRQTPVEPAVEPSEPRPFIPPAVQREQSVSPEPDPAPALPTRRFETDVFLERLRAASAILPDDEDDELDVPNPAAAPALPANRPDPEPQPVEPQAFEEPEAFEESQALEEAPAEPKPSRPERRTAPERKPRPSQPRARPAQRSKAGAKNSARTPTRRAKEEAAERAGAPATEPTPVAQQPAAQQRVAPQPLSPAPPPAATPAPARATPPQYAPSQAAPNPYTAVRPRPPSLQFGLLTAGPVPAAEPAVSAPPAIAPEPGSLDLRSSEYSPGGVRGALGRLLGGRFGRSSLPKPSPSRPIDAVGASEITQQLTARGASQAWTSQLISTAGAHGSPLTGSLRTAAEAEIAKRIVPGPALPVTGAAVAFIGAGGTGKTRCTAALASAYSRTSTLGVTVVSLDNPGGARELTRLLSGEGVPVLSLRGERAARAIAAARRGGFVIVDTPTATPTDPAQLDALAARLEPLELDATYVTLPATLGAQAARRALASFGQLHPSAVAITHADETDQLGVVVEIATAYRIPLAYLHAGADHQSALTAIDASALAHQLLNTHDLP